MGKKATKSTLKTKEGIFKLLTDNLMSVAIYSLLFFITINTYLFTYNSSDSTRVSVNYSSGQTVLAAEDVAINGPALVTELPTTFPVVSSQGVMVLDINSGKSLFEKNADISLLPASTVKMMTAVVVLEHMNLSEVIEVGEVSIVGQKMGLIAGEKITVENLLTAMLVYSANDAAEALAQSFPGGRDAFIVAMNQKANEIGLANTNYNNPSGLDGFTQFTTARDLVMLGEYVLSKPPLAAIVQQEDVIVESDDGVYKHSLRNTNELLGKVEGVKGIKTGWTENARENLVVYVERDDKKVMFALLGSQDRFGEMEQLINWVFDNYEW